MHPCLYVDEIVRLIAYELVAFNVRATSVALACCCKTFEDLVLDVLWKTQSRVLPLLKSLPRDVWDEGGCRVSAPTTYSLSSLNYLIQKSFKRLPTTLELARFRKYAGRIRTLEKQCNGHYIPQEVFSALQLCATGERLLPNLKTLYLWCITKESISSIPLFISPITTSVTLKFDSNDFNKTTIASVVTTLPTTLSKLAGNRPAVAIKRSDDHCCYFQGASLLQSECPPVYLCRFPIDKESP